MTSLGERLRSGRTQFGVCVTYPAAGIVERIGPDWDWIWICTQHGQIDYRTMLEMVRVCNLIDRPAFPRVPSHEFGAIGRALDTGADGVIVPVVETAAEAREVVQAAKFPPLGGRSYGGRRCVDVGGRRYTDTANDECLLMCQIETPAGIENAEAIAAVPGVDALFFGPDDLMLRRGYVMDTPRTADTVGADMEVVAEACHGQGKLAVFAGVNEGLLPLCVSLGYHMLVGVSDAALLSSGSGAASEKLRKQASDCHCEKGGG